MPAHQLMTMFGPMRQSYQIMWLTSCENGCPPLITDVEPSKDYPAEAVAPESELAASDIVSPTSLRRRARLGTSPDALDGPGRLILSS